MSKKKIIYVWKSPYPWDVRVEKICKSLAKEYDVLILSRWGGEEKKVEQIDGITIKRVGFREKSYKSIPVSANPIWKKELKSTIDKFNPDLIIVREIMLGTLVGKLCKKYNIPAVMDMAENYPAVIKLFKKYKKHLLSRILIHYMNIAKIVEKKSLSVIENILVVCKEQIERLKKETYFINHKMAVVENTPIFEQNTQINKSYNKPIFGHHGNLTADKSIFKFLKIIITLLEEGVDLEFHIMGSGEIYEETKHLVKESGFTKQVLFYGNWEEELYIKYINKINIGVLPYEVNDFTNTTNFNKYYDFLKSGIPVVTSNTLPMTRINNEMDCGISIDINNKEEVIRIIKSLDNNKYQTLANNAYKAYKTKYNWNVDEEKLLKFIGEII